MRAQLEQDLYLALNRLVADADLEQLKMLITLTVSKYEVDLAEKHLIVYEGDVNENILRRFIAAKLAAGLSKRTIKYYKETVEKVLYTIGKPYDQITTDDLRLWVAKRVQMDGVTKVTVNNERRCLSSFYSWLQKEEILLKNPMSKLDSIKITKKKKKAYSLLDLEKMRTGCRTAREKAIVEVLASTWCRVSEAVGIKIDDIRGEAITVHGKGDKYRDVYLNARAQIAVSEYLKERTDNNPYLFPKAKYAGDVGSIAKMCGTMAKMSEWYKDPELVDDTYPMDVSSLECIIRGIGKRAGVEKAHPHRFRRTGATLALRAGMPILTVSKLLGHESLETTQIYLDISDDELRQAHERFVV